MNLWNYDRYSVAFFAVLATLFVAGTIAATAMHNVVAAQAIFAPIFVAGIVFFIARSRM